MNAASFVNTQDLYRFHNTRTGAHFYTASAAERDYVLRTWPYFNYEGVAYRVSTSPTTGGASVYRFYNTRTNTHFYTASTAERDQVFWTLPDLRYEGVAFYTTP